MRHLLALYHQRGDGLTDLSRTRETVAKCRLCGNGAHVVWSFFHLGSDDSTTLLSECDDDVCDGEAASTRSCNDARTPKSTQLRSLSRNCAAFCMSSLMR